jgi:small subunit ribosomal protein S13
MAEDQQQAQDAASPEDEEDEDFRYIVRVENTDLDGHQPVMLALTGIKGIGERVATVIVDHADLPRTERIGDLPEEDIDAIQETVSQIEEILPDWMVNRRRDFYSGENGHLLRSDLDDKHREDLNRLKKVQAYRGIRHEQGRKVRGQRTRANGRSGSAMGVEKAAVQAAAQEGEGEE